MHDESSRSCLHAYVAGLLDADGHVSWRSRPGRLQGALILGVSNVSDNLMAWLRATMGGSVSTDRRPPDPTFQQTRQFCHHWILYGERAAIVVRCCAPYMRVKRERALALVARWDASVASMERPNRRRFDSLRAREAMQEIGWLA